MPLKYQAIPDDLMHELDSELSIAMDEYDPFNSLHEAISVIREEYLELETEIYKKDALQSNDIIKKECLQIAAMCMRLIIENIN